MKIGDLIASLNQNALPGFPFVYNGVDFDLLLGIGDTADAIAQSPRGLERVYAELAAFNGTTFDRLRSSPDNADAVAVQPQGILRFLGAPLLYNGASFDRQRANLSATNLVTLTAASASGNSADQVNFNHRGVKVVINITAITGTSPTLVVNIQGKDAANSLYYTQLASATLNATGQTVLTLYPGIGVTANVSASDILPRDWRISYTIGGTTPAVTATISAAPIL